MTFQMCTMKVLTCVLFFGLANCITLDVTGDWEAELGWRLNCSWAFPEGDRLQSVRLYIGGQQFMIFRPETDGDKRSEFFRTPDNLMRVDCEDLLPQASGSCLMKLEPYHPPTSEILVTCEVSGERPYFRMKKQEYIVKPFVAPSDASVAVAVQKEETLQRLVLNCSSTGLPAPSLTWVIDDQKVPSDFTGRSWNSTTKLWHSWSTLTTTPDHHISIQCTPEVTYKALVTKGQHIVYDAVLAAGARLRSSTMTVFGILTSISCYFR